MPILTLRPNSDVSIGSDISRYPESGGYCDKVDEAVEGEGWDTDFIYNQTTTPIPPNNDAVFGFPPHSTESGVISSVKVYARCKHDNSPETSDGSVAIGANDDVKSPHSLTASYVLYSETWTEKPGGGAWTWDDIDAIEVVIRLTRALTENKTPILYQARCTQVYVEVTYSGVVAKGISDSLSLSQTLAFNVKVALADTLSLSEALLLVIKLSLDDNLSLSDAIIVLRKIALVDSLTLSEQSVANAKLSITESLGLVEALSLANKLSISTSLSLDEALNILDKLTVSDVLTLSEFISYYEGVIQKLVTDGLSLSEALNVVVDVNVEDNLSLADLIRLLVAISRRIYTRVSISNRVFSVSIASREFHIESRVKESIVSLSARDFDITTGRETIRIEARR